MWKNYKTHHHEFLFVYTSITICIEHVESDMESRFGFYSVDEEYSKWKEKS